MCLFFIKVLWIFLLQYPIKHKLIRKHFSLWKTDLIFITPPYCLHLQHISIQLFSIISKFIFIIILIIPGKEEHLMELNSSRIGSSNLLQIGVQFNLRAVRVSIDLLLWVYFPFWLKGFLFMWLFYIGGWKVIKIS